MPVALLAEGVDRNDWRFSALPCVAHVALLAEGVDRNLISSVNLALSPASPSSRRAWIEMSDVAYQAITQKSPSSRRAWIEIFCTITVGYRHAVALLAEGVDRNSGDGRQLVK